MIFTKKVNNKTFYLKHQKIKFSLKTVKHRIFTYRHQTKSTNVTENIGNKYFHPKNMFLTKYLKNKEQFLF